MITRTSLSSSDYGYIYAIKGISLLGVPSKVISSFDTVSNGETFIYISSIVLLSVETASRIFVSNVTSFRLLGL